jgi:hypothetical protein
MTIATIVIILSAALIPVGYSLVRTSDGTAGN